MANMATEAAKAAQKIAQRTWGAIARQLGREAAEEVGEEAGKKGGTAAARQVADTGVPRVLEGEVMPPGTATPGGGAASSTASGTSAPGAGAVPGAATTGTAGAAAKSEGVGNWAYRNLLARPSSWGYNNILAPTGNALANAGLGAAKGLRNFAITVAAGGLTAYVIAPEETTSFASGALSVLGFGKETFTPPKAPPKFPVFSAIDGEDGKIAEKISEQLGKDFAGKGWDIVDMKTFMAEDAKRHDVKNPEFGGGFYNQTAEIANKGHRFVLKQSNVAMIEAGNKMHLVVDVSKYGEGRKFDVFLANEKTNDGGLVKLEPFEERHIPRTAIAVKINGDIVPVSSDRRVELRLYEKQSGEGGATARRPPPLETITLPPDIGREFYKKEAEAIGPVNIEKTKLAMHTPHAAPAPVAIPGATPPPVSPLPPGWAPKTLTLPNADPSKPPSTLELRERTAPDRQKTAMDAIDACLANNREIRKENRERGTTNLTKDCNPLKP
jgi:hypothetical protein